ncbi:MAG: TIGR03790 family protein [Planctomycetes bacterium]|nr:TIGR03790 family protein [Planctomycetota bacterium]
MHDRRYILAGARLLALLCSAASGAAPAAPPAPHPEAARTIVLASETVPEGVAVARHYMAARGIPAGNLCLVRAPADEEISREAFNQALWQPLRAFLARWEGRLDVALPDARLRLATDNRRAKYLVPVCGVPIKIKGYEQIKTMYLSQAAAVDSELALVPGGGHKLAGSVGNPYFGADAPFGPPLDAVMVLASRLDGPSPEIARRLVDDALAAEAAGGLRGRAYVDTRGILKGEYSEGDEWLRRAAEILQRAGLPTEVDARPEVLPLAHPMPDAAVYLGWYADQAVGPMTKTDFRFNRGAVAYHLQSFTGAAIREPRSRWVGPLLARGACLTAGAVYEPFLAGTPHVDILMDRLLRGCSWGEAAGMAQPQLSWQMCFIGDPLYRPFPRRQ